MVNKKSIILIGLGVLLGTMSFPFLCGIPVEFNWDYEPIPGESYTVNSVPQITSAEQEIWLIILVSVCCIKVIKFIDIQKQESEYGNECDDQYR